MPESRAVEETDCDQKFDVSCATQPELHSPDCPLCNSWLLEEQLQLQQLNSNKEQWVLNRVEWRLVVILHFYLGPGRHVRRRDLCIGRSVAKVDGSCHNPSMLLVTYDISSCVTVQGKQVATSNDDQVWTGNPHLLQYYTTH